MSTIDTADHIESLTGEAILYQVTSAIFSRPGSDKFSMLVDLEFTEQADAAANLLDALAERADKVAPSLGTVLEYASHAGHSLPDEYALIFGHTLSNDLSPYEMEFLQNDEIFYRTQHLADLQGFYGAFGFEVNSIERADHISVESEFMALLLTKEAYALSNNLGIFAIEVCNDARTRFSGEHYTGWVKKLAFNLRNLDEHPFYAAVGRFITAFLN